MKGPFSGLIAAIPDVEIEEILEYLVPNPARNRLVLATRSSEKKVTFNK